MKRIDNYYPMCMTLPSDVKVCVYNLSSPRTGEPVKNQFCILGGCGFPTRFQSYRTTCLVWDGEVLTVYPEAFGYSVTTSKYSRVFLMDECHLTAEQVNEISKMAKQEEFGRDCPLYIQVRGV